MLQKIRAFLRRVAPRVGIAQGEGANAPVGPVFVVKRRDEARSRKQAGSVGDVARGKKESRLRQGGHRADVDAAAAVGRGQRRQGFGQGRRLGAGVARRDEGLEILPAQQAGQGRHGHGRLERVHDVGHLGKLPQLARQGQGRAESEEGLVVDAENFLELREARAEALVALAQALAVGGQAGAGRGRLVPLPVALRADFQQARDQFPEFRLPALGQEAFQFPGLVREAGRVWGAFHGVSGPHCRPVRSVPLLPSSPRGNNPTLRRASGSGAPPRAMEHV